MGTGCAAGVDGGLGEPMTLYRTKRLDCGHSVAASEDSGGMDELDRVTLADVERLLAFKVASHNCERFVAAERIRAEGRPFGWLIY